MWTRPKSLTHDISEPEKAVQHLKRVPVWLSGEQDSDRVCRKGLQNFKGLTTIPPMVHRQTVQRDLTHIPARVQALQEVRVGCREDSGKKSPQNGILTWFHDQLDVSMPKGLPIIAISMGSLDLRKGCAESGSCIGQTRKKLA